VLDSGFTADLHGFGCGAVVLSGLLGSEVGLQLLAGGLHREASLVQPGVLSDLADAGALGTVVAEERQDQVLELGWEAGSVGLLEVQLSLTGGQQVVEVFFGAGLLEGEDALDDDEQNDAKWEEVDLLTIVGLAFLDLGSHVGEGATVALEAVDVFEASKAKVSEFEVHLLVNEDVFKLEVAVDNSVGVHVLNGVKHLISEEPSGVLAHLAKGLANVKEETALHVVHDQVDHVVDDAAGWLLNDALITVLDHADDALMLEGPKNLDFGFYWFNCVFFLGQELLLQDLNGDLRGGVANLVGKVDFASVALTEGLHNVEFLVEDGVLGWELFAHFDWNCLLDVKNY
jgi:hypothetical protein